MLININGIVRITTLIFLIPTFALAQLVDNGGDAAFADTTSMGQPSILQNVTTTFDQIHIEITHIINEPTDFGVIRIVAQVTNLSEKPAKILRFIPAPRLVDEMGNQYLYNGVSGLNKCVHQRLTDGRFNEHPPQLHTCKNYDHNALWAYGLPTGVPVTISLVFAVPDDGSFVEELATQATYATLDMRFVHSRDGFKNVHLNETVVPNIRIPEGVLR